MFWERFSKLCSIKGVSANAVCSILGLSTAAATHWKNGTMPKGDVLSKIADYFDVSVDYLLGRTENLTLDNEQEVSTVTDSIELSRLSESQRAMLKCRINQIMINRFRKENYFEELNAELSVDNSFSWFLNLNDFSLDDKIPQMLTLLNIGQASLFNDMNIVIKTKGTAQALQIDFSGDAVFPILVSGAKIFNALSSLSISSLAVLDKEVLGQIEVNQKRPSGNIGNDIHDELKSSFKTKLQV